MLHCLNRRWLEVSSHVFSELCSSRRCYKKQTVFQALQRFNNPNTSLLSWSKEAVTWERLVESPQCCAGWLGPVTPTFPSEQEPDFNTALPNATSPLWPGCRGNPALPEAGRANCGRQAVEFIHCLCSAPPSHDCWVWDCSFECQRSYFKLLAQRLINKS